jgi:hypothetical protein
MDFRSLNEERELAKIVKRSFFLSSLLISLGHINNVQTK